MTTPEPPDEPTPPSFEKPADGGSPYGSPPPYPSTGGYGTPYPSAVPPPYPASVVPPLGGLGERLLARIIDLAVMLVVGGVVGTVVVLASSISVYYIVTVTILFAGLIGLVYEGMSLSRVGGRTLGKTVVGLRVAAEVDGSLPDGRAAWTRSAVFWLPIVLSGFCLPVLFLLLDILWCTWDHPYRQCLHDKAARTVVVKAA
jgi:uncharacterized RDD family membrane protein YckC